MFKIHFTEEAKRIFEQLKERAASASAKKKSSKQQGLFKQVKKTLLFLSQNPRHPGLRTHEYSDFQHPWDPKGKIFEAYIQNRTPRAYRLFWCYGPKKGEITIITIIPHP